jgi:hypothetical protein
MIFNNVQNKSGTVFSPEFYTFSRTFLVFIIYISQSQHVARRSFGIGFSGPQYYILAETDCSANQKAR